MRALLRYVRVPSYSVFTLLTSHSLVVFHTGEYTQYCVVHVRTTEPGCLSYRHPSRVLTNRLILSLIITIKSHTCKTPPFKLSSSVWASSDAFLLIQEVPSQQITHSMHSLKFSTCWSLLLVPFPNRHATLPPSGKPTFYFIVLFHAFSCFWCFLKEKK